MNDWLDDRDQQQFIAGWEYAQESSRLKYAISIAVAFLCGVLVTHFLGI